MSTTRKVEFGFIFVCSVLLGGCGSNESNPGSTNGPGASTPDASTGYDGPDTRPHDDCIPAGIDDGTPFSKTYRVRPIGTTSFQGTSYRIVTSMPWTYVLSSVQCHKNFPIVETDTHYIVDSKFELPYIKGVLDDVAWTPGVKNKGWAIGSNDDPEALVKKNGAMRPFVYHVNAGYEYGYFTYTNDPLPGDGIHYSAFRPTWVVHPNGAAYDMFFVNPAKPDDQGFAWPRHGNHWELDFGLYVDPTGHVHVPKPAKAKLGTLLGWDDYQACVVINKGSAPIPTTRTQFPGNESYYASETFLPGHAAPGAIGHRYWGQKGRTMEQVAIWEDDGAPGLNSPGNYHKPYSGGCDTKGYNFAHAEGFTWPELRAARTKMGDVPTRAQLYKVTLYRYEAKTRETKLLGTLSYEQREGGQWFPTGSGPEAHSLNDKNGRWIINGPVFRDRGDHVFAILEDL
ncbi:hypothetical protein [Pendulispora albinea]|uniref:Uncharacterized protein n=1 Tax=Pendulispora albinea TaxID=2741071 RepID=A0ABZ2LVC7_9BACT